jgi:hypothetical protein
MPHFRLTLCAFIICFTTATLGRAQEVKPTPESEKNRQQTEKERRATDKQAEKERNEKEKQEAKAAKERAKAEARALANRIPILSEYDRFKDVGSLYFLWRTVDIGAYGYFELFFGATYVHSGTVVNPNGRTILILQYNRYGSLSELPNHNLEVIADGERFDLGAFQVTGKEAIASRSIRVTTANPIPLDTLIKLGNARVVEARFGGVEFRLKDNIITAIQDLVQRIPKN